MNKYAAGGLIFAAGSAVGALVTWLICRKEIKIKEEEIQSVISSFTKMQEENAKANREKPDILSVAEAMTKTANELVTHTVDYSKISIEEDSEEEIEEEEPPVAPLYEEVNHDEPYVLNRLPYAGEDDDYTRFEVKLYSDGTYADRYDKELEIEEYIGRKMMDYAINSDQDEIFIRNEELLLDIDITKDARTYDEVMFG